jgi:tetratricopeptide (TPR) repeat protein
MHNTPSGSWERRRINMAKNKIRLIIAVVCIMGIGLVSWSIASTLAKADYNALGVTQYEAGNYDKAIEYFSKAIERDPENADAYYNRGICYTEGESFHHYDKLPGQTYIEAGLEDEEEAFQNAMADFNQALELDPNYALAHFGKGNANYLYVDSYTDRATRVIPEYEKALEHKDWILDKVGVEGVAAIYTNLGRTYFAMCEMDKAYKNYKEALDLAPIDTALEHQAPVCVELGKYAEAYQLATEYIAMAEGSEEFDLALMPGMIAAYHLKKYDEAIEYGDEIIETFPDSGYVAGAHRFLAKIYTEKGIESQAKDHIDAAINMCTEIIDSEETAVIYIPGAYYERGLAYFDIGEYEKAINDFGYLVDHPEIANREIAHENYYFEGHIGLACAYSQVGENEEAKGVLENALVLLSEPNFQGYQKYREAGVEALLDKINAGESIPIPMMYQIIGK